MICKVRNTIEKYGMLDGVKTVAVGVSGGADSMCLLHILSSLKQEYDIMLKVVHINHNIRGDEAKRDEDKVRLFCEKQSISFTLFSEDIPSLARAQGLSEEECGRNVRYECFEKMNCDAVAVAHSLSDSIETMVFNMIRGTASKGLCGIPPSREPNIIRPLIECTRAEIEQYCADNSLEFVTDSTNLTDDYTRNFIRHNIVGNFRQINSAYERNISSLMNVLSDENDFISESTQELLNKSHNSDGSYDLQLLKLAHIALRKRVITLILKEHMNKSFSNKHVEIVNEIIEKGSGKVEIARNLYITVSHNSISVDVKKCNVATEDDRFINDEAVFCGEKFILKQLSLESYKDSHRDCFDADKIKGELTIGSRRQGDKFTLKNRNVTKSLKKLFNELKIPVEKRERIAVIHDGENIVWIQGIGTNEMYTPDKSTKTYILIEKEV